MPPTRSTPLAYNAPTDTKEVVELAESKLLKVTAREVKSSYKTLTEFMVEAYNEAEEVCKAGGQAAGVPTGLPFTRPHAHGFPRGPAHHYRRPPCRG